MTASNAVLYYVHDPMCSWCWGFKPVWEQVQKALKDKVTIRYVLGGLAADSDQPMPEEMQLAIKRTWQRIQQEIPGTEFNYDFWTSCQPRRSTYPACRAVLAAKMQADKYADAMLSDIQQAYYLQAKNPSDTATLVELSRALGLDVERFKADLGSNDCEQLLKQELTLAHKLGVNSFPSLVLDYNGSNDLICIDYTKSATIVSSVLARLHGDANLFNPRAKLT